MKLKNKKIGLCIPEMPINNKELLNQIRNLSDINIIPIVDIFKKDNKRKRDYNIFFEEIQNITSNKIIHTEYIAEELGKKDVLDIILVLPCNENIIPKLANNIFDSPTMRIVKYQLINDKPIVLGISASNGLSSNAENIGRLLNRKSYYFIPFKQTNPITKPYFITFEISYIFRTLEEALNRRQIQPIILSL